MNLITERRLFPQFLRKFDCVVGISLGECIDGSKWKKGIVAHAHCDRRYKYSGVICIARGHEMALWDEKLMMHEVAHLICGYSADHNRKWRDTVERIGGTYKPILGMTYKTPDFTPVRKLRKKIRR